MFGFINDYLKNFDLKNNDFKLVVIDGSFICIQGFISILKVSEEEIVLKIKSGELLVSGNNLIVKELGDKEITICGNIFKVER